MCRISSSVVSTGTYNWASQWLNLCRLSRCRSLEGVNIPVLTQTERNVNRRLRPTGGSHLRLKYT